MDKKGGKGKGKGSTAVNLVNKVVTRLNQKAFFIRSVDAGMLMDANYVGKVVLSEPDNNRQIYQKFEFTASEVPGVYMIKSVLSGLYLCGDELGNVFTDLHDHYNTFQKWNCTETTAGSFVIKNHSSNLAICVSLLNDIFSKEIPGPTKQKVLEGKETKIAEVPGDIPSAMQWTLSTSR
jgi:hypothetical protein